MGTYIAAQKLVISVFLFIACVQLAFAQIVPSTPSNTTNSLLAGGGAHHNYTAYPLELRVNVTLVGSSNADIAWAVISTHDSVDINDFDLGTNSSNVSLTRQQVAGQQYTFSYNFSTNFSSQWFGPGPRSVYFCTNSTGDGAHNCTGPWDFIIQGVNVTDMESNFGIGGPMSGPDGTEFFGMDVRYGNGSEVPFSTYMDPNVNNYTFNFNFTEDTGIFIVGVSINQSALSTMNTTNFTGEITPELETQIGEYEANLTWVDIESFIPSELGYEFGIIQIPGTYGRVMYCNGTSVSSPSCEVVSPCNASNFHLFNYTDVIPANSGCYLEQGSWGQDAENVLTSGFTWLFVDHFSGGLGANDFSQPNVTFITPLGDVNISASSQFVNFTITDTDSTGLNLSKNGSINVTVSLSGTEVAHYSYGNLSDDTNLTCLTTDIFSYQNTTSIACNFTQSFASDGAYVINVTGRDTSNNSNPINVTGSSIELRSDTTGPSFRTASISHNNASSDDTVAVGVNISDDLLSLSTARLFVNVSGTADNQVAIDTSVFNDEHVNLSYTLSAGLFGHTLNFTIQANDSLGNLNQTFVGLVYVNSTPGDGSIEPVLPNNNIMMAGGPGGFYNYSDYPIEVSVNVTMPSSNTADSAWVVLSDVDSSRIAASGSNFTVNYTLTGQQLTGQKYLFSGNLTTDFNNSWQMPGPHALYFCTNATISGNDMCSGPYDYTLEGVNVTNMELIMGDGNHGPFVAWDIRWGNGTDMDLHDYMNVVDGNFTFDFNFSDEMGVLLVAMQLNTSALGQAQNTNFTDEISPEIESEVGSNYDINLTWVDVDSFLPDALFYEFGIIRMPGTYSIVQYCDGNTTANPSCEAINSCNATAISLYNHTDIIPTNGGCYVTSGSWGVNESQSELTSGFTWIFVDHFSGGLGANDFSQPQASFVVPSSTVNVSTASQAFNFTVTDINSTGLNLTQNNTINFTIWQSGSVVAQLNYLNHSSTNLTCTTTDQTSSENTTSVTCNTSYSFSDGTYEVNITGRDASNNSNPINRTGNSIEITVDTVEPSIDLSSPATNLSNGTSRLIANFTSADATTGVQSFTYSTSCNTSGSVTSGANFNPFSSQYSTCNSNAGYRTVTVNSTDHASNSNVTVYTFGIDNVVPTVSGGPSNGAEYTDTTIWFNVSSYDVFSKSSFVGYYLDNDGLVQMAFNAAGLGNTSSPFFSNVSVTVGSGTHTVYFVANDSHGNLQNSSVVTFTVLSTTNISSANETIVNNGADKIKKAVFTNSSGAEVNGTVDINQSFELFVSLNRTSEGANITINFDGTAANWDKTGEIYADLNHTSIGNLESNMTADVITYVYINDSFAQFLSSNTSYYGVIRLPVNVTGIGLGGTVDLLYFADETDLTNDTEVSECSAGFAPSRSSTSGLPCWNNTDNRTIDVLLPHFSSVAMVNDTQPPTIDVNEPQAIEGIVSFTPNITVSADAVNCSYMINSTLVSETAMTLSGTTCTAPAVTVLNNSNVYNVSYLSYDSNGNLNVTQVITLIADGTTHTAFISDSGNSATGTTVSLTANESVNMTVEYGTTTALGTVAGSETDFDTSQSVSISLSTVTSATTIYYNVTSCDRAGNCVVNGTLNFTQTATSSDSGDSSGGGGGSSGGGGGGGAPSSSGKVSASKSQIWSKVLEGSSLEMKISNDKIAVTDITVSAVKKTLSNVDITVESLSENPRSTDAAAKVYQYLNINKKKIENNDAGSIVVGFKIPKSWLKDEGIGSDSIALYRYASSKWNELSTWIANEDSSFVYFEASTPGFSSFAIGTNSNYKEPEEASESSESDSVDTGSDDSEESEDVDSGAVIPPTPSEESKKRKSPLLIAVVMLVLILSITAVIVYIRNREHHY